MSETNVGNKCRKQMSETNVGNKCRKQMSETLSVTQRTVERDFAILQKAGIIRHEGKVNAGIWVVLENSK